MPELPIELRSALHLRQQARLAEAEQQCRLLLERMPNHAEGRYVLGLILSEGNSHQDALGQFQQALQIAPSKGDYWLAFAETLLKLGRDDQALEIIDDLIGKGLDWPQAIALRDRIRSDIGETTSGDQATSGGGVAEATVGEALDDIAEGEPNASRPGSGNAFTDLLVQIMADPIVIVDVGAAVNDLQAEPYQRLVQANCATVIGFEPDVASCEKLNRLYGQDGRHHYHPWFIGTGEEALFHETSWSQTASFFRPNRALLDRFENIGDWTQVVATRQVPTVRLDDVPELGEVDLIKIDVQGGELDVFRGARRCLASTLLVWTEVEFAPLYERQPLFADIDRFLREKSFCLHSLTNIGSSRLKDFAARNPDRQPLRPQLLWADAIYILDYEKMKQLPARRLKKMALLLDQVVGAHDLCLEVLGLLDHREGTKLVDHYYSGAPGG